MEKAKSPKEEILNSETGAIVEVKKEVPKINKNAGSTELQIWQELAEKEAILLKESLSREAETNRKMEKWKNGLHLNIEHSLELFERKWNERSTLTLLKREEMLQSTSRKEHLKKFEEDMNEEVKSLEIDAKKIQIDLNSRSELIKNNIKRRRSSSKSLHLPNIEENDISLNILDSESDEDNFSEDYFSFDDASSKEESELESFRETSNSF
jgi:hypothetical protein